MNDTNGFGLIKDDEDGKEERYYHLNAGEWVELFNLVYAVVQNGAAISVYTSRGRNALCVAIKHGKDRTADWIGPDDAPYDKLDSVYRRWGIRRTDGPVREWVDLCIEDDRRARSDE